MDCTRNTPITAKVHTLCQYLNQKKVVIQKTQAAQTAGYQFNHRNDSDTTAW